jgi:hypothetical protein
MTDDKQFDSLREQIMEAVAERLRSMKAGQPVDNPYAFAFNTVQREPLSDDMRGRKFVVYVNDSTAKRARKIHPLTSATIDCSLEYAVIVEKDEKPNKLLNLIASECERRLMEDVTFGGLCYELECTKDEKAIGWRHDKAVEGVLYFTISFRYNSFDPRLKQ